MLLVNDEVISTISFVLNKKLPEAPPTAMKVLWSIGGWGVGMWWSTSVMFRLLQVLLSQVCEQLVQPWRLCSTKLGGGFNFTTWIGRNPIIEPFNLATVPIRLHYLPSPDYLSTKVDIALSICISIVNITSQTPYFLCFHF